MVLAIAREEGQVPRRREDFYDSAERIAFVDGRRVYYEIARPHPWRQKLMDRQFLFARQEVVRVRTGAPIKYRPNENATVWLPRVVEDDEMGELGSGTVVYASQYTDGTLVEVPEEWLEKVGPSAGSPMTAPGA
jgi:hypothetical protein